MWESIREFLSISDFTDAMAQVVGLIGAVVGILSFQQKTARRIVLFQLASSSLWTLHMLMIGGIAGTILNVLGIVRAIVYSNREKHAWARHPAWFCFFLAWCAASAVLSWTVFGEGWVALLPAVAMTISTIALRMHNPFLVRGLSFFVSPNWLAYGFLNGSIIGVINECINMVSIVVAVIRHDIPALREKRRNPEAGN